MIEDAQKRLIRLTAIQGLIDSVHKATLRYGADKEKVSMAVQKGLERLGFENGRYLLKDFPNPQSARFQTELRKISETYVELMESVRVAFTKDYSEETDDDK